MSIKIKFKDEEVKTFFGQIPFSALFIDNDGYLLQKQSESMAVMIADKNGYLDCRTDIEMNYYEEVKKVYDIEKIEFS